MACANVVAGLPDAEAPYAGKIVLAGVSNAYGADASSANFGADLDQGIFVATSEQTNNLLIFNFKDLGACLPSSRCGVRAEVLLATAAAPATDSDGDGNAEGSSVGTFIVAGVGLVAVVAVGLKLSGGGSGGSKFEHDGDTIYADDSDLTRAV